MQNKRFLCFAEGRGGRYHAICVDLDIAVEAPSLHEAIDTLNHAIVTYIEDAAKEDEATAARLLARRAPWHVRLGYKLRFVLHMLTGGSRKTGTDEASFAISCPA